MSDDPDTIVALGCIAYKEGDFDGARNKFNDALNALG